MIEVKNRRCRLDKLISQHPDAVILDVTSKAPDPWVRFSPFYPHGNIPVPGLNCHGQSVEGIWQALKVFEKYDIDLSKLDITSMRGIKRTVRKFGKVLGHRYSHDRDELLNYVEARRRIYIPSYNHTLLNNNKQLVDKLCELLQERHIILLDYETNGEIDNTSKPLSHAHLIARHVIAEVGQEYRPEGQ